jgi:CheY-like chemotaxis protein
VVESWGAPRSAVVCEDDAGLAVALRTVLSAHDCGIAALLDRAALLADAVRAHAPDVVVVDAALLVTRGVDLLRELSSLTPAALVVLCPTGLELSGLPCDVNVVPAEDLSALHRLLDRPRQTAAPPGSGSRSSKARPV